MSKKKESIEQQAEEVLERAKQKGIETNFFFRTTFERYQFQMEILRQLKEEFLNSGVTVEKEYVKNRKNVYTNPVISEYNKTSTACNNTVATLINIVKSFSEETEVKESKLQALMKSINE